MGIIENATAAQEVASAMALGGQALKSIAKHTSVESVDRVMDEIHEAADRMAEVQQALAQPVSSEYLDESELDAELAELEQLELDSELLGDAAEMPAAPRTLPVAPARQPAAGGTARAGAAAAGASTMSQEERELEALQAEMAM